MIALSSHLHCLQWDICFIPYLYSSANNMSFIHLAALKIFILITGFEVLFNVSWCNFINVSVISILLKSLHLYFYCIHQIWGHLSHYFFRYLLWHPLALWILQLKNISGSLKVFHSSLVLWSFLKIIFVCFILNSLYCCFFIICWSFILPILICYYSQPVNFYLRHCSFYFCKFSLALLKYLSCL